MQPRHRLGLSVWLKALVNSPPTKGRRSLARPDQAIYVQVLQIPLLFLNTSTEFSRNELTTAFEASHIFHAPVAPLFTSAVVAAVVPLPWVLSHCTRPSTSSCLSASFMLCCRSFMRPYVIAGPTTRETIRILFPRVRRGLDGL